jgi:hypothetical protein
MSGIYFGNSKKQVWIKAPKTGLQVQSEGWSAESKYLSGRAFVKRSRASHRKYNPSWLGFMNSEDGTSINIIKDFADGVYGDGPFYFVDPYATDSNVMPQHWATPHLTEKDWPALVDTTVAAAFVEYNFANNFPVKYASYTVPAGYESTRKLRLIIPSGYKLHFGWHGTADSSTTGVRVVPYLRSTGGADTAINPVKITAGGLVRANTHISGTTYSMVDIFIASDAAPLDLQIVGMIAQILPDSSSVASGKFITGRGNTGIEFSSFPNIEYYSAAIGNGLIGLSCDWTEI